MAGFPDHPFWDFSLRVYGSEGVAPACLALQEAHELDVNFLLFCCWLAASGRGAVGAREIARLHEAVAGWHGEIVRNLRAVRKRLKEPVGGEDRELALSLRQRLQKIEIDAEHIEQLMLAAAGDDLPDGKPGNPAEAARANALAYFAALDVAPGAGDLAALETIIATAVGSPSDRD